MDYYASNRLCQDVRCEHFPLYLHGDFCVLLRVTVMTGSMMSLPLAVVVVLSVLLTGATHAGPEMDPYKILGVTKSASQAEIKKVYKRLAKEW